MKHLLPLMMLAACSPSGEAPHEAASPDPLDGREPSEVTAPDAAAREARVRDAHTRLDATEGGQSLRRILDVHGGLDSWYTTGTYSFDFDYQPYEAPERRMFTHNQVDTWSGRVRQTELGDGADATLGWDGSEAWIVPSPDAFPAPAAFWATTPYYFAAIPFVLADPGTQHAFEGAFDLPMPDGTSVPTLVTKVSFEPGTGQAPDDYYVVHADPQTFKMVALRYIVTDPAVRRSDAPPPKETILYYSDERTIHGLHIPHHYDGYRYADGAPGVRKSTVDLANVSMTQAIPLSAFSRPE